MFGITVVKGDIKNIVKTLSSIGHIFIQHTLRMDIMSKQIDELQKQINDMKSNRVRQYLK